MTRDPQDLYAFTAKRFAILITPGAMVLGIAWVIVRYLSHAVIVARQCSRYHSTFNYTHCLALTDYIICFLLVLSAVVAVGVVGLICTLAAEFLLSQWGGFDAKTREMLVAEIDETIWWWIGILAGGIIVIFVVVELVT